VADPAFEILYLAEDASVALFEVQALLGSAYPGATFVPNPAGGAWSLIDVHLDATAGEQGIRQKCYLLIGSAKGSIEVLQEARESEETTQQGKRCETDNGVPLVGFRDAIADAQLHRRVTAANPTATDEIDFAFESLTQVHADQRGH